MGEGDCMAIVKFGKVCSGYIRGEKRKSFIHPITENLTTELYDFGEASK